MTLSLLESLHSAVAMAKSKPKLYQPKHDIFYQQHELRSFIFDWWYDGDYVIVAKHDV